MRIKNVHYYYYYSVDSYVATFRKIKPWSFHFRVKIFHARRLAFSRIFPISYHDRSNLPLYRSFLTFHFTPKPQFMSFSFSRHKNVFVYSDGHF